MPNPRPRISGNYVSTSETRITTYLLSLSKHMCRSVKIFQKVSLLENVCARDRRHSSQSQAVGPLGRYFVCDISDAPPKDSLRDSENEAVEACPPIKRLIPSAETDSPRPTYLRRHFESERPARSRNQKKDTLRSQRCFTDDSGALTREQQPELRERRDRRKCCKERQ